MARKIELGGHKYIVSHLCTKLKFSGEEMDTNLGKSRRGSTAMIF